MSISFSGSTLTFSDSTTMTTAAVAGPPGSTGPTGSTGGTGPTGPAGSNASVVTTYGAVGTYVIAFASAGTASTYTRPSSTIAGACLKRASDAAMDCAGCYARMGALNSVMTNNTRSWKASCIPGSSSLGLSGTWSAMAHTYQRYACNGPIASFYIRVS